MGARLLGLAVVLACSLPCALAQQGHPLVGTWSGYWGVSADERHRVLLVLAYDGERVTGVINPGRASIELTDATLDPARWTVKLEAAASERTGGVRYLIEGRIENLGSITERTLAGTWTQGGQRGDFRLVMN
ncbi:MAG TPA: hypothetical protein VLD39_02490 [Gammaproteobacteria bacterium]|nr:hypothetical protein [Gammaproteobacteria bacterium]